MEKFRLITDKQETEQIINSFFGISSNSRLIKELTLISQKKGFNRDYESLSFKHELDEEDINMIQQPMTDKHILISISILEYETYIPFDEFYEYLKKTILQLLKQGPLNGDLPFDESEILRLLEKIKVSLEIH